MQVHALQCKAICLYARSCKSLGWYVTVCMVMYNSVRLCITMDDHFLVYVWNATLFSPSKCVAFRLLHLSLRFFLFAAFSDLDHWRQTLYALLYDDFFTWCYCYTDIVIMITIMIMIMVMIMIINLYCAHYTTRIFKCALYKSTSGL